VPVEAQPIFRPDAIRLPILGFSLPEPVAQRRTKLEKWAEIISTGSVHVHKEQEIPSPLTNDASQAGSADRLDSIGLPEEPFLQREVN